MLVTIGAAIAAGERLSMLALAGIVMVSLGVFSLSRPRFETPIAPRALVLALITGACIAGYMVADGMGARLAGNAIAYALWLEVVNAFPLPTILLVTRGTLRTKVPGETWRAVLAGVMSMGYVAVVWAMSQGAMGAVSALRETSVVFAALIGRFLLGEQFGWRRFLAAAVIALGIVAIGLAH
jgi:drug/metabolite transporter (DMT)-like permease